MRILPGLALLLVGAAALGAPALAQGSWSYAYTNGAATATMRDEDGDVAATISCRPPTGDLVITDYELRGRGGTANVRAGSYSMPAQARGERGEHGRALVIAMPQSPPVLAAALPNATIAVEAGGRTHTLAPGASERMWEVATACWPTLAR